MAKYYDIQITGYNGTAVLKTEQAIEAEEVVQGIIVLGEISNKRKTYTEGDKIMVPHSMCTATPVTFPIAFNR